MKNILSSQWHEWRSSTNNAGNAAGVAVAVLGALISMCTASAMALQPMNDVALSSVQGRDGLSFDLSNFAMSGDARITYYAPSPSTSSAYIGNLYASRSDDTSSGNGFGFGDPYRLEVKRGANGLPDYVSLSQPQNANGLQRWQYAFDWGTHADGMAFDGGSMILKDTVFYGGGTQWTTPRAGDGIAFGTGLRMDVGNLLLRPRGRGDITSADSAGTTEQMHVRGLRIGATDGTGALLNTPWRIADVAAQPGILNAVTDGNGNARLHFGIDWPDANGAATGTLRIDNIAFRSDVTGNLDLGSSRIGAMQIQYLDVKVKP
jgi:hypothetical protein